MSDETELQTWRPLAEAKRGPPESYQALVRREALSLGDGGRRGLLGSATYRFPIWRHINKQFLHVMFKDLYGGVFFEAANAWNETELKTSDYKKSIGGELRLNLGSYYSYPTTISYTTAYGLDEVIFVNPVFTTEPIIQGKNWRHYFLVGFTF